MAASALGVMAGASPQMLRPERMRQQFLQREARAHAVGPRDVDRRRRVGEFADALAAAAAGRAEPLAVADHQNFRDAAARPPSAIAAIAPASAQAPCG